jgi:hypothetical protein
MARWHRGLQVWRDEGGSHAAEEGMETVAAGAWAELRATRVRYGRGHGRWSGEAVPSHTRWAAKPLGGTNVEALPGEPRYLGCISGRTPQVNVSLKCWTQGALTLG